MGATITTMSTYFYPNHVHNAVSPIPDTDETDNDDDIFLVSRIRDKFQNKIRL